MATLEEIRALIASDDGATISVLGDSTGNDDNEWVALWAEHLSEDRRVTVQQWSDEAQAYEDKLTFGEGGPKVTIWNGSHPGAAAGYGLENLEQLQPKEPDVTIYSYGHNNTAVSVTRDLAKLTAAVEEKWSTEVPAVITLQNPSLGELAGRQETTMKALKAWAQRSGLPMVDVAKAFSGAGKDLVGDLGHPTRKGSRIWADVVIDALG